MITLRSVETRISSSHAEYRRDLIYRRRRLAVGQSVAVAPGLGAVTRLLLRSISRFVTADTPIFRSLLRVC